SRYASGTSPMIQSATSCTTRLSLGRRRRRPDPGTAELPAAGAAWTTAPAEIKGMTDRYGRLPLAPTAVSSRPVEKTAPEVCGTLLAAPACIHCRGIPAGYVPFRSDPHGPTGAGSFGQSLAAPDDRIRGHICSPAVVRTERFTSGR